MIVSKNQWISINIEDNIINTNVTLPQKKTNLEMQNIAISNSNGDNTVAP